MRNKYILIAVVLLTLAFGVGRLSAGTPDSPSAPGATNSFTLEDIYNRLNAGTAGSQSTFTEPATGPGSTMHTLDEIMAQAQPRALAKRVNKTGQTDCYKSALPWGTCTCGAADCPSGQDGDLEMGIDPAIAPTGGTTGAYNTPAWTGVRFTDNGDGTVTDNLTALIWLKNANCLDTVGGIAKGSGYLNWANALTWSNNLANVFCGLSDGSSAGQWRLPNVNELHSLGPTWPPGGPFTGVQSSYYWTSTTYAVITSGAWGVYLYNGLVSTSGKSSSLYVWPVRGGQ